MNILMKMLKHIFLEHQPFSKHIESNILAEKELTLRFIGRTLANHGLSTKPKVRVKGASRYLHYPATLIQHLGQSILEIDFIGKKFIENRTKPVNFIGFSLTKPRKLKYFQRVESETAAEAIAHCQRFFRSFPETGGD